MTSRLCEPGDDGSGELGPLPVLVDDRLDVVLEVRAELGDEVLLAVGEEVLVAVEVAREGLECHVCSVAVRFAPRRGCERGSVRRPAY